LNRAPNPRKLLRPAIFLDRDGTIIEDRGHLDSPGQVVFYPQTVAALRRLAAKHALFIVTNQPGIAEGVVAREGVEAVNSEVVRRLGDAGVEIVETFVCPHRREEGCRCIKPRPYFLGLAAGKHGLDLGRSWVVGDHPHDIELAANAGARAVYVLTGHGSKHRGEAPAGTPIVAGIGEAAEHILSARRDVDEVGCGSAGASPSRRTGASRRRLEGEAPAEPAKQVPPKAARTRRRRP
jgi:histidinol-phosphate phosphatase family protein